MNVAVSVARKARHKKRVQEDPRLRGEDAADAGASQASGGLSDPLLELRIQAPTDPGAPPSDPVDPNGASSDRQLSQDIAAETRSGGRALPDRLREAFEAALGRSLSHVRLHQGPGADRVARAAGAEALSTGSHILLASNVSPETPSGRRTLAHELVHIMQFDDARVPGGAGLLDAGHALEREAWGQEAALAGEVERRLASPSAPLGGPEFAGPDAADVDASAVEAAVDVIGGLLAEGDDGSALAAACVELARALGRAAAPQLGVASDPNAVRLDGLFAALGSPAELVADLLATGGERMGPAPALTPEAARSMSLYAAMDRAFREGVATAPRGLGARTLPRVDAAPRVGAPAVKGKNKAVEGPFAAVRARLAALVAEAVAGGGDGDGAAALPFGEALAASFGEAWPEGVRVERASGGDGSRGATVDGEVRLAPEADLRVAAHEIAHVVQQRAGLVPDGYRSRAGDVFERQADAVADAVVAGRSADSVSGFASPTMIARAAGPVTTGAVQADRGDAGSVPAVGDLGQQEEGPERETEDLEGPELANDQRAPGGAAGGGPRGTDAPSGGSDGAGGDGPELEDAPLPHVDLLAGAGGGEEGPGGGGGAEPGGATLPTGPDVRPAQVTTAFRGMSPTTQVGQYRGVAGAMRGAAEATQAASNEAAPELHATLSADGAVTDPGEIEVSDETSASAGAVDEARDDARPVHDEGDTPNIGRSPVRPSAIRSWFEEHGDGDPERMAQQAMQSAQAGGDQIPTTAEAPKLELTGQADPQQATDGAQRTSDEAASALADARAAVTTGPGPEIVQLRAMDEIFEAPQLEAPEVPDFAQQVEGMDQYQEWDLPANVQAQFDEMHGPTIDAHLAEAETQVADAQGQFETDQDAQIAATEAEVAAAQSDAQRQQEEAVGESRRQIQESRQSALDQQQEAVADLNQQVRDERTAVMSDIDSRVSTDQGRVDREMSAAEREAQAEVAAGERKADAKAKEAEEEDDSFWGGVFDAIADAISAITDALVAIWDAVREAVTAILDAAVALANTIIDAAISFISEALGAFLDMLTALVGELLGTLFPELAAWLQEKLQEFKTWAQEKLEELGTWLKEQVKAFADALMAALNAIFDALIGALKFAGAFLEAVLTGDWDKVLSMTIDAIFALAGIDREEFEEKYGSAEDVFKSIIENPGKLIENAIAATGKGFEQFGDNFWDHFIEGAIEWISGSTGIDLPSTFDLSGVFSVVAQVLGLTKDNIKEKIGKHAGDKAAAVFDFAWDAISALISGGWEGLWDHIKDQLSGLWDMAIGAVTTWITEKVVMRGVQFIASLSTGVGAIVEGVIALWNFGTWLYDNISRILDIVRTVLSSTIEFVAGNIQPAADKIEGLLGKLIPVAIDLVTKMIGLGGLPDKVREIIGDAREMVNNALDKLIEKIVKTFKPGRDDGEDDPAKRNNAQFDGELGETVPFNAGGEAHKVWVVNQGGRAVVMVASTPMTIEERIRDWQTRLGTIGPNNEGLTEGNTKDAVSGWISRAAQLAGVTLQEANETIAVMAQANSTRAPASGSADTASPVDRADKETEEAEHDLAAILQKLFAAFGDTPDAAAIDAAKTLTTPQYESFAGEMKSSFNVDDAGSRDIWLKIVQQLIEKKADYLATIPAGDKYAALGSEAFQKLTKEFKLPEKLRAAFEAAIGDVTGKRLALWSGKPAKDAARQSGAVFLEGTAYGQPFDAQGLPSDVKSATILWAALSRAYAQKLAENADKSEFIGFVGHDTRSGNTIADQIEQPAMREALSGNLPPTTWYGAATIDGASWKNEVITLRGQTLTEQQGFWGVGTDRDAMVKKSKEQFEKYKELYDAASEDVDSEVPFSAGGENHKVVVDVQGADATLNVHSEKKTGKGHLVDFKNKLDTLDEDSKKEGLDQINVATTLINETEALAETAATAESPETKEAKQAQTKTWAGKLVQPFKWLFDKVTGNTATRKSLKEILVGTGASDIGQFERLLSKEIEKNGRPVTLEQLPQTDPKLLLTEGRDLWWADQRSDLGWLEDAAGALDNGARKVHIKGMLQKVGEATDTTVTQAALNKFADAVFQAWRTAAGGAGEFTKIFDDKAKENSLDSVNSAKNKWLPALEIGGIGSIFKYAKNFADGEAPAELATKVPLFKDVGKQEPLLSFEAKTPIIPGIAWVEWGGAKLAELTGAEGAVSLSRSATDKERTIAIGVAGSGGGTLASLTVGPTLKLGIQGLFSIVSASFVAELAAKGSIGGEVKYSTTKNLQEDKPPAWSVGGSVKAEGKLEGSVKFSIGLDSWLSELKSKKEKVLSGGGDGADNTFDALEGPDKVKVHDALEIDPTVLQPKLEWTIASATFADFVVELAPRLDKASDDGKARFAWNPKAEANWHVGRLFAELTGNTATIEAYKAKAKAIEDAQKLVDEAKKAKNTASDNADAADSEATQAEKEAKRKQDELDKKKKAEADLRLKAQAADDEVSALDAAMRAALEELEDEEAYLAEVEQMAGIDESVLNFGRAKVRESFVRYDGAKTAAANAAEKRDKIKATLKSTEEAIAEVEALLSDLRKKAAEARAKANEAKALAQEAEKKLDEAKGKVKELKDKGVKEFTAKVSGGGENHTLVVKNGEVEIHSTPTRPSVFFHQLDARLASAEGVVPADELKRARDEVEGLESRGVSAAADAAVEAKRETADERKVNAALLVTKEMVERALQVVKDLDPEEAKRRKKQFLESEEYQDVTQDPEGEKRIKIHGTPTQTGGSKNQVLSAGHIMGTDTQDKGVHHSFSPVTSEVKGPGAWQKEDREDRGLMESVNTGKVQPFAGAGEMNVNSKPGMFHEHDRDGYLFETDRAGKDKVIKKDANGQPIELKQGFSHAFDPNFIPPEKFAQALSLAKKAEKEYVLATTEFDPQQMKASNTGLKAGLNVTADSAQVVSPNGWFDTRELPVATVPSGKKTIQAQNCVTTLVSSLMSIGVLDGKDFAMIGMNADGTANPGSDIRPQDIYQHLRWKEHEFQKALKAK